jgi:sulfopropanediol 3-dehydrogenase
MPVYLKRAVKSATTDQAQTREIVAGIIEDIRRGGEAVVRELAAKLDNWKRDFILTAMHGGLWG